MLLELSEVEGRELKQALDTALRELLDEISRTDQRAYRDMLRERHDRLEQLNRRLEMSLEGNPVYA
ncbi:hypothetical protein OWM54_22845 [Myxococcus sp. MISCRS1]|jgi:DNA anti-recombination protein RmuC|uniref:hypothetical protein n=1 Tax=Myxococcus TaxID=32 RepID=UPI001CBF966D|nr:MULTISPECIES: hypothetical protein [unclassified Myxococcus]MBZ4398317.1 hypothetical protein [Myxococcus sp. AS-1-15]MBZ4412786.1 hypothetical protein [Myxococcus sp. XM-1-1-1]MCY0999979.1 hypothetical protein [Myxococcus sp. MISCRS1]BDT38476.1 hypothetical protein MFMH1_81450 [Myxococcus sp. MH1]